MPSSVPLLNVKPFVATTVPPVGKTEEVAVILPPGAKVYTLATAFGASRQAHDSKLAAKINGIFDAVPGTTNRGRRRLFRFIKLFPAGFTSFIAVHPIRVEE